MKHCVGCSKAFPDDTAFCPHCGKQLVDESEKSICPNCKKDMGEKFEQFCPHCGYQVSSKEPVTVQKSNKQKYVALLAVVLLAMTGGFFVFKQQIINMGIISPSTAEENFQYAYHLQWKKFDPLVASQYYKKAAHQGHAEAQYRLAGLYFDGEGVSQSRKTAVMWYKKAAEQGLPEAQHWLGHCYRYGLGVDVNFREAIRLFELAAEKEDTEAIRDLGDLYCDLQMYPEAIYWLEKSMAHYNLDAQGRLAMIYYDKPGVKDAKKAYELATKAAERMDSRGLLVLGKLHYYNNDYKDVRQAIIHLCRVGPKANYEIKSEADYILGKIYSDDESGYKNLEAAFEHYSKAANELHSEAMLEVSKCYRFGYGVEKDTALAQQWFRDYYRYK